MGNKSMTMMELKKELLQNKSCAGGYLISFEAFKNVYEFIHRMIIRNHREVSIVLMNIFPREETAGENTVESGCQILEQTILKSLRREDVAARCADDQYVILLMNADVDQGTFVAQRLIRSCQELDGTGMIEYSFEIYGLNTEQEVKNELGVTYGLHFRDKCCIYNNQWISYCLENHHIDAESYKEGSAMLINRMCLKCGYKWTVQHEEKQDVIRKVWSEGRWWNHPME